MGFFSKKEVILPPSIKKIEEQKTLRIVRFQGPIDYTTLGEIGQFVEKLRSQKDYEFKNILLDFMDVTHIDSSTAAEVIQIIFDIKKSHHKLGIVNLSQEFRSIFEILKIDKIIHFYEIEAEATTVLEMT